MNCALCGKERPFSPSLKIFVSCDCSVTEAELAQVVYANFLPGFRDWDDPDIADFVREEYQRIAAAILEKYKVERK